MQSILLPSSTFFYLLFSDFHFHFPKPVNVILVRLDASLSVSKDTNDILTYVPNSVVPHTPLFLYLPSDREEVK